MLFWSCCNMSFPSCEPSCGANSYRYGIRLYPDFSNKGLLLIGAQGNLMKARDERIALMNEVWHSSVFKPLYPIHTLCRSWEVFVCWRYVNTFYNLSHSNIRTKFMAWERNFEAKVMKVREKELKYQKLNYTIEVSLCLGMLEKFLTIRPSDTMECYLVNSASGWLLKSKLWHPVQERLTYSRDPCFFLAFHCCSTASSLAIYRVHFGKFYPV